MSESQKGTSELISGEGLPETLPESPLAIMHAWFEEAVAARRTLNPDAIALATADARGVPSVRIVLCKHLDDAGYLVFYTNHNSRKGRELAQQDQASAVFHFDAFERQIRVEGRVVQSPESESDRYFASRSVISRIGAWASDQSQPIASREDLLERVSRAMERLGVGPSDVLGESEVSVPRPPHWGGFRLWFERVELWAGGAGRIHDRAAWTRELAGSDGEFSGGPWSATRVQP